MKMNKKNITRIIILLAVIISIVILGLFLQKGNDNKIKANNDNKSIVKTDELNKDDSKTSEGNASDVSAKAAEAKASADAKDAKEQAEDKTTKVVPSEEGITVFVKEANFGSTAEIITDSSKFSSSYKYYQFFLGNKPISKIESITKSETTIFPAQKATSEVMLHLLDENNKVAKEVKIILNEKK
ncbi:MAG: putative membrane protein [Clostridium sp.]|jgi:uncharacterized membrane protein